VRVVAVQAGRDLMRPDRVATEEPMEIRVAGPGEDPRSLAVTMRTPGHDFELACGFLFTEGLVRGGADVRAVTYCDMPDGEQLFNVVTVHTALPWCHRNTARQTPIGSSCGTCGKTSLDQVEVRCLPVASSDPVPASVVASMPEQLSAAQDLFALTGAVHAAGLFGPEGEICCVREDVGRHNALDKVVGRCLLDGLLPLERHAVALSGRVSFEMVQKAAVAGVGLIVAVSAPTSLAVDAAERLGVCLAGFVRDGSFNLYAHPERIDARR
jgi:FdhD protein